MSDNITLNVLFPPVTSLGPANIALAVYALLNIISLVITVVLYAVNTRASKQNRFFLSSSFQTAENISITILLCWTLTVHTVIMMVFEGSNLYIRTSVQRGPLLTGLRMLANVTPLGWLSFPTIIMLHVNAQEKVRRRRISGLVAVGNFALC
ncbi:hypothetical protein OESDEN_06850 [Oesophagostomum dentatum]|uniref:G-protein coupled receptors family 1 profile domain-containing protein n=1 Tax=Oesophagostomum dentatum TaxID=61180 RepID=A0A0B1TD13_OESDE|nr:hypothetical protein OESDEN_06850 [Oesophagostomum dentatum]